MGSTPKWAIIQKKAQYLLFLAHPAALFMALYSTGLSLNKPKTKDSSCSKGIEGFSHWVLLTIPIDAMCGFESLNTFGNQILGELKCAIVVDDI